MLKVESNTSYFTCPVCFIRRMCKIMRDNGAYQYVCKTSNHGFNFKHSMKFPIYPFWPIAQYWLIPGTN